MELTRRDALASLAATSLGFGGMSWSMAELSAETASVPSDFSLSSRRLETVLAVAEVVYPSEVEAEPGFVETYFDGRSESQKERFVETVDGLDELARRRAGEPFAALSPEKRTTVFREIGIGRVESNPSGTVPAQVQYYLVNGLLYALYTSPAGSSLFGIENPTGHPGGYGSYQVKPQQ
jgi:hypothetical protein